MSADVCPFCERPVSTHIAPDAPRDSRGQLTELGASLCPVVRDTGRNGNPSKGEKSYDRYYRVPTPKECRAWREAQTSVAKPAA